MVSGDEIPHEPSQWEALGNASRIGLGLRRAMSADELGDPHMFHLRKSDDPMGRQACGRTDETEAMQTRRRGRSDGVGV